MYENQIQFKWWFASEKKKKLFDIIIVATSVFNDGNKYYPQVFLDDCFYKLMVKI